MKTTRSPGVKREQSQVNISTYQVSLLQLHSSIPQYGAKTCMMRVMEGGSVSLVMQSITNLFTWGEEEGEGVTVALRAAIPGGGRGLSRPMLLCTQNLPW
jgi:hypothetical protein